MEAEEDHLPFVTLIKKKKHKKKMMHGLNVSKSKLSISQSSSNKNSFAIKATLKANNRALAHALEVSRHETRYAQESCIERQIEVQQLQQQLLNLQRVAGLKNDELEKEVHQRFKKEMGQIKTLLSEVTNKLIDAVTVLGTALEISSSRKSGSLKSDCEPTPEPKQHRTIYNHRKNADSIFASQLTTPSCESRKSNIMVESSGMNMSVIAEQSFLVDESETDYLPSTILQTVHELSPPVEKSTHSKRLARRQSRLSLLNNQENSPNLTNEDNTIRKTKATSRRLSRQSLNTNASPKNELVNNIHSKQYNLQTQDLLNTAPIVLEKRKSITPPNLAHNPPKTTLKERRLTFCVPTDSEKDNAFSNDKIPAQNLQKSDLSSQIRRTTFSLGINTPKEQSALPSMSREKELLLKLQTFTQERLQDEKMDNLKGNDNLFSLEVIPPPSPTFMDGDRTTILPVDMELTGIIESDCTKISKEETQPHLAKDNPDQISNPSVETIQTNSINKSDVFIKPGNKIPKKKRASCGTNKNNISHSDISLPYVVSKTPERKGIKRKKSLEISNCRNVNLERTSVPFSIFELSMNDSTHPDLNEFTHLKKKNGQESVLTSTEITPHNIPSITTRRKQSDIKHIVDNIEPSWTPLSSGIPTMMSSFTSLDKDSEFSKEEYMSVSKINESSCKAKTSDIPINSLTSVIELARVSPDFSFIKNSNDRSQNSLNKKQENIGESTCTERPVLLPTPKRRGRKSKIVASMKIDKSDTRDEIALFDTPAKPISLIEIRNDNETSSIHEHRDKKPKGATRSKKKKTDARGEILIDTLLKLSQSDGITLSNKDKSPNNKYKQRKLKSTARSKKSKHDSEDELPLIDILLTSTQSDEIALNSNNKSSDNKHSERKPKSKDRLKTHELDALDELALIDTPLKSAQSGKKIELLKISKKLENFLEKSIVKEYPNGLNEQESDPTFSLKSKAVLVHSECDISNSYKTPLTKGSNEDDKISSEKMNRLIKLCKNTGISPIHSSKDTKIKNNRKILDEVRIKSGPVIDSTDYIKYIKDDDSPVANTLQLPKINEIANQKSEKLQSPKVPENTYKAGKTPTATEVSSSSTDPMLLNKLSEGILKSKTANKQKTLKRNSNLFQELFPKRSKIKDLTSANDEENQVSISSLSHNSSDLMDRIEFIRPKRSQARISFKEPSLIKKMRR